MSVDRKRLFAVLHPGFMYFVPILALFALVFLLNYTSPSSAGPISILAVFVLIYIVVFGALALLLRSVNALLRIVRIGKSFEMRKWYYVLSVVALAPVLLVALNTLGQLGILELVLVVMLVCLGCFYVIRRSSR